MIWFVVVVLIVFLIVSLQARNVAIQSVVPCAKFLDKRVAIQSVVPGAKFLDKRKDGNPFLDDDDYRYVVSVDNGWVQYKCGQHGKPIHSMRISNFIDWLEFVENT